MAAPLGQMSVEYFLEHHWQKTPVLVRNGFSDFKSPIEPDDLAGLALEPDVESRIILEEGENGPWELRHGPFTEATFDSLPETKWTLLVQGVDLWVPEIADLMEAFKFIPGWRRDDIMASFAPDGGSVGPHFDQYDVFLIQAEGQREWKIGPKYTAESQRIPNTDLHILQHMEVTESWVLNPGDILYVPPQYAHHGIAKGDCMTFSVGFRAPSHSEILQSFTDYLASELTEDQRYGDPDILNAERHSGLIDAVSIARFKTILRSALDNDHQIGDWLGQSMTENKDPELHEELEDPLEWGELQAALLESTGLTRNETSRLAYIDNEGDITLFANGQKMGSYSGPAAKLVIIFCDDRYVALEKISGLLADTEGQNALLDLINGNHVYFV